MDEIFKPFLSGTTPLPPKLNVNATWSALAPMDERNQTPNVTFGNTCAETLRFGGAGVQRSACCRVWTFCPSTVSLSDVFTSFGLQTLLWKHYSACCWSFSNLRKTLPFHKQMHPVCLPSHFFFSLIRNLFQNAENIVFSQVNATFVFLVPTFPIPSSMQSDVSTTEFGDQKMWKHQRGRQCQLRCAAGRTPQLVP